MSSDNTVPSGQKSWSIDEELDETQSSQVTQLASNITGDEFTQWYQEKTFKQNVQNGQTYFNGPSKFKHPGKFTPSELLSCHRKTYYKKLNAPKENPAPNAIFYIGSVIEEDLVEEFIRDKVTDDSTYQQNDLWVNFSIPSSLGDIELNGSTDPVVVDEDGIPLLPTEIKTTSDTQYVEAPKETHKAQAHAYMYGLTEQHDRPIDHVVLFYIGRNNRFEPKEFVLEFDSEFWTDRVIPWLKESTYYQTFGLLPPNEPERDWECDYCDYRSRCGRGDDFYSDEDVIGFLPLFEYPRTNVINYLEAHSDAGLTPSLAHLYPDLTDKYEVHDWQCSSCGSRFTWDEFDWNPDSQPPKCPECSPENEYLSGPKPSEQRSVNVDSETST